MAKWRTGQSGNPGGRPKLPLEVKKALRKMRPEMLDALERLLRSADMKDVAAALRVGLPYVLGPPNEGLDVEEEAPRRMRSNEEVLRLAANYFGGSPPFEPENDSGAGPARGSNGPRSSGH